MVETQSGKACLSRHSGVWLGGRAVISFYSQFPDSEREVRHLLQIRGEEEFTEEDHVLLDYACILTGYMKALPAASEEPIVLGGTPLPAETEMPTEQAALPATGHRMLLTAQGDCWVSTTADGKNSQRVMHKGDTLNVDFQEKLVMKLGNAGAMLITYDGKELPPVGKIGQVKTVTFPNDAQN